MERTLKEMVPKEYLDYQKVFSEEDANWHPPKRPWDHAIDLTPDAPTTIDCKVYPLMRDENQAQTNFSTNTWRKDTLGHPNPHTRHPSSLSKRKTENLAPSRTIVLSINTRSETITHCH